ACEFIGGRRRHRTPGPGSHSGRFFSFDDVEAYPGPYRPGGLPILIGGNGTPALRRVAARGDGWHGIGLEPSAARELKTRLSAELDRVGRDPEGIPLQVRLHIDASDLDPEAWTSRVAA